MNTSMDTLMIEINSTSKDATKSIDRLVQSLSSLQKSLKSVVEQSKELAVLKNNMANIKVPSTTNIPKKSSKTFKSEESQLSDLDINLDTYKMISSIKTVNSELVTYKNKAGDVVTINRKFEDSADGVSKKLSDVKVKLKQTNAEARKGSSVWSVFTKGISGTIAKFSIFAAAGRKALNSIGGLVDNASNYEESLNLFTVTLGEYAEQADKWVKMFSDALYLDPNNVMKYMGSFNSLIKGLGTGSEKAYLMSKNLTQLTFDLASFKNLSFEEAFQKLQSGISGEIEPLRNVGVALSQATLQELAYSMGIKTSVADMNEAQKSQLRYIQIMKSSVEWQTDMGRTLISPANALRVVRQQFSLLGQAIGRIFIPMVMAVIPYIMVLTKWLTTLANKIAKFLGYEIADIDYSGISAGFSDIGGGISDIGDAADKATDKLNTMLAPFDDLNVVQNQTKNAASGIGGIGGAGDLGVDLPEYDALANLTDKFSKNMDKARENLKKILPIVLAIGAGLLTWKIGKLFTNALIDLANFKNALSTLGMTKIPWDKMFGGLAIAAGAALVAVGGVLGFNALKTVLEQNGWDNATLQKYGIASALVIGGGILIGIGIALLAGVSVLAGALIGGLVAAAVVAIAALGVTIATHWEEIKEWFHNAILGIGDFFVELWNNVTNFFSGLADWFNINVWEPIYNFLEPILKAIGDLFYAIGDTVKTIWGGISNIIIAATDSIFTVVSTVVGNVISIVGGIFTAVWSVMKKIAEIISTTVQVIWVVLSTAFNAIKTPLVKAASWVYNKVIEPIANKIRLFITTVITLFTSIVTTINNKVIKPIVNLFSGVVTTVIGFFKNIGVSVANAFAGTFKSVLNGAFTLVENLINGFIDGLNAVVKIVNKLPGVDIKYVSKLKIPRFAQGGYPTSGDLFFANENGVPEMVGRIGNQTAVANNDQITTSITNALLSALSQYDFGGSKSPTTIYIGNKKVYEGYGDYVSEENDRYGTNMIRI